MKKNKLIVFGGAFNPPLNSHFSFAEQILNEVPYVEKIIFVPVSNWYQKQGLIDEIHRYKMLKLVCDQNKRFDVSDVELNRNRQLYTVETLEILQEKNKDKELYFTIGSDNLKELENWNKANILVEKFRFLVIERDKDSVEKILKSSSFLDKNRSRFEKLATKLHSNLSSSFVREEIKNEKSIKYLTPNEVIEYIEKNNLYK